MRGGEAGRGDLGDGDGVVAGGLERAGRDEDARVRGNNNIASGLEKKKKMRKKSKNNYE